MTVQEVTGKQETLPPTRILRRRGGLRHAVTLRVITGGLGILVAAVLYLPARVVPQPLRLVLERTVTALVDQLPDSPPLKLSFVPPSNGPQPAPGGAVWVSDTSDHSSSPNSPQPPAVGVQPSPTPSQLAVVSGLSASPPELPTATPAPPVVLPLVQGNQAAVTAPPPPTAAPVPVPTAAPTTAPTSPPTAVPVTTPAPTPRHSPKPKPTPTPTPTAVPVSVPAAAIPDPTASPSQAAPSPTGGVASPSPSPSASPLP